MNKKKLDMEGFRKGLFQPKEHRREALKQKPYGSQKKTAMPSFPEGSEVYFAATGRQLLNRQNFPKVIKHYLRTQDSILAHFLPQYDTLIEVGCFTGTHRDQCLAKNVKYIGIDMVEEYIEKAVQDAKFWHIPKHCHEFHVKDVHQLEELFQESHILKNASKVLVFFPFNVIGNIPEPERLLLTLKALSLDYFISSFDTNHPASLARLQYYQNCGYQEMNMLSEEKGLRFKSQEGLSSIAYHAEDLFALCESITPGVILREICDISYGLIHLNGTP